MAAQFHTIAEQKDLWKSLAEKSEIREGKAHSFSGGSGWLFCHVETAGFFPDAMVQAHA